MVEHGYCPLQRSFYSWMTTADSHLEVCDLAVCGHTLYWAAAASAEHLMVREQGHERTDGDSIFRQHGRSAAAAAAAAVRPRLCSRVCVLTLFIGLPLVVSVSLYTLSSASEPFVNLIDPVGITAFREQSDPPPRTQHYGR